MSSLSGCSLHYLALCPNIDMLRVTVVRKGDLCNFHTLILLGRVHHHDLLVYFFPALTKMAMADTHSKIDLIGFNLKMMTKARQRSKLLLVNLGFLICHIYWLQAEHLFVFNTGTLVIGFPRFLVEADHMIGRYFTISVSIFCRLLVL